MKTKIELTTEMESRIHSVVEEYVIQRVYDIVCQMDDNEVRDKIKDMLFDEGIIDGVQYEWYNEGGGELPLTTRKFNNFTSELTEYLMKKIEGVQPI